MFGTPEKEVEVNRVEERERVRNSIGDHFLALSSFC